MKLDKNKLFKLKKALLALAEIATEEGVTLITDNELEVGAEVFVNGEEGLVPASDGTYSYNNMVITVEGGVVTAIADKPVEEETPETEEAEIVNEEEAPVEEEITQEVAEIADEIVEEVKDENTDVEALKSKIAELEALVEELKAKLEEPVAESVEEEMKKEEKKNEKTNKRDYVAMMRKAREIKENKKIIKNKK